MENEYVRIHKHKLLASITSIVIFCLVCAGLFLYSILSPQQIVTKSTHFEVSAIMPSKPLDKLSQLKSESEKKVMTLSNFVGHSISKKEASTTPEKIIDDYKTTSTIYNSTTITHSQDENNAGNQKQGTLENESSNNCIGGIHSSITGRTILSYPLLSSDTREEGKVVVEITVNKNGKVIKANPNGKGSTTNNPILKEKAKIAAQETIFNVSDKFEEQNGTITILFKY